MKPLLIGILSTAAIAAALAADVRVNINLGAGHPLVRTRTVIVHRAPYAVGRVVWAPPVVWTRALVALPPRERMVWEDSETLVRREDWVDTILPVHNTGAGLFLRVDGRAQLDFADVHFGNGQAQVVDFHEGLLDQCVYRLLDFADGRRVESVRLVARARTPRSTLAVLMRK